MARRLNPHDAALPSHSNLHPTKWQRHWGQPHPTTSAPHTSGHIRERSMIPAIAPIRYTVQKFLLSYRGLDVVHRRQDHKRKAGIRHWYTRAAGLTLAALYQELELSHSSIQTTPAGPLPSSTSAKQTLLYLLVGMRKHLGCEMDIASKTK